MPKRTWETEFHYAARTGDLPEVLSALQSGQDVSRRDQRGNTALALAAQRGHLELVRTLLDHGAHVDSEVKWRLTPLALAIMGRHAEVALLLIDRGARVNHVTSLEDRSLFSLAVVHGLHRVVTAMLTRGAEPNHCDARGRTALSYARENADTKMVRLLTETGAVEG